MKSILLLTVLLLTATFIKAGTGIPKHNNPSALNRTSCPSISNFTVTAPSCFGYSNGSLALDYTAGTPGYTVSWVGPVSYTTTSSALTQSVSGIVAGAYVITLTDNAGCSASQYANVSQPTTLLLNVASSSTICNGQSATIYAVAAGGTPPYTYTWSSSSLSGSGPHVVSPTVTTAYIVAAGDNNGCTAPSKTIAVNVLPALSVSGNSINVCLGNMTLLTPTITSPGNGGPYTYNWNTGATTNTISVQGNTTSATTNTYAVNVSDGCTVPSASATFTVNSLLCTGLNELQKEYAIVYPNPTRNLLNVFIPYEAQTNGTLQLTDALGNIVNDIKIQNKDTVQLNMESYAAGIYFLKIESDRYSKIVKVIKD